MSTSTSPALDHWSSDSYASAADFVHKLTESVLRYLSPAPSDRILDIGCGDGKLTAQIASAVPHGLVRGLDRSANFISFAQKTFPPSQHPNLSFEDVDCAKLGPFVGANRGTFDKVFSNAALHWILREPSTRASTLRNVFQLLKPGGKFVFEMGGAGNVAEVHAALMFALVKAGVSAHEAKSASPWFFPSDVLMQRMLIEAGFEVQKVELEYRPTKLETGAGGGLRGWIELLGA